jgi:hypothetical protein
VSLAWRSRSTRVSPCAVPLPLNAPAVAADDLQTAAASTKVHNSCSSSYGPRPRMSIVAPASRRCQLADRLGISSDQAGSLLRQLVGEVGSAASSQARSRSLCRRFRWSRVRLIAGPRGTTVTSLLGSRGGYRALSWYPDPAATGTPAQRRHAATQVPVLVRRVRAACAPSRRLPVASRQSWRASRPDAPWPGHMWCRRLGTWRDLRF